MKLKPFACLALASSLGLGGCADEEGSGALTVNYELGFSVLACDTAGVVNVAANLGDIRQLAPCAMPGEITIGGAPARTYRDFLVEGIDAEGITVYDSIGNGNPDSVTVVDGSSQVVDVTMTETPAVIQVSFNLLDENGFAYGGQAESPVTAFEVFALRGMGNPQHTHEFIVAQQESLVGLVVPDEGRAIDGTLLNGVRIDYTSMGTEMTVDVEGAAAFSFDPPGRGRLVEIIVECRADMCTGTLLGTDEGGLTAGEETATATGTGAEGTGG